MKYYYKIQTMGGSNSVIDSLENIQEYLKESEAGEVWTITVLEMTDEEYKALPESDGL